jgi:hypothetical protein
VGQGLAQLILDARAAGLTFNRDGSKVVIRGPKRAAALAEALLDRELEVLALLDGEAVTPGRIECLALAQECFRRVNEFFKAIGCPESLDVNTMVWLSLESAIEQALVSGDLAATRAAGQAYEDYARECCARSQVKGEAK